MVAGFWCCFHWSSNFLHDRFVGCFCVINVDDGLKQFVTCDSSCKRGVADVRSDVFCDQFH